jgi:hypothetical protein
MVSPLWFLSCPEHTADTFSGICIFILSADIYTLMGAIAKLLSLTALVIFIFLRPEIRKASAAGVMGSGSRVFVQETSMVGAGGPIDDLVFRNY